MPESSFDRDVLKTAVAQICHSLGWNSMQKSSLGVLTDVLERYMKKLSKATAGYCQHSSRTDVSLSDLGIAFDHLGIQICELEDYVHQVEPIHFPKTVAQFQQSISTAFHFPTEEELASREEWYEEYMPPLGRSIKNADAEMKLVEESEVNHMELAAVQPIDSIEETSVPPIDVPSNERPMESPDVEAKAMWNNKLCLPDLVRPKLPSFDFTESPSSMKQPSLPPSTPTMPILPLKRVGSPLKSREKNTSNTVQEKADAKEPPKMDILSPKPAKRPKVLSSPLQQDILLQSPKDTRLKDNAKRPDSLALENSPKDLYQHNNFFSPIDRDSRLSPVTKPPSTIHSPSSEKITQPSKAAGTPFLEWSSNQISTPLSDKKSKAKKPKKVKKAKNIPSKSSKQNAAQPFSSSPQLFGSPHVLKSPPEQRVVIASQANIKGSPKKEGKVDHTTSSFYEKAPSTPEIKSKLPYNTPHQDDIKHAKGKSDMKLAKVTANSKKQSSKKAKKNSTAPFSAEMKEKSPLSVPEMPQLFASVSLTKLSKNDSFRSPSSTSSPGVMTTPKAAVVQDSSLNSPECKTHDAKHIGSSKGDKKISKKEEKKRKKEKKNKKKPIDEEPKNHKPQKAKHDTPSLKLTFKRAPSGAYSDHQREDAPTTLKLKSVSPTVSYPTATPTAEASPKKITSPPPEQKSRKSKKVKASAKKPDDVEKRPEPAVKIEPLVINDSYSNLSDYTESSDAAKKPEAKSEKAAKKDASAKKVKPTKKPDTGKKVPKKKAETTKKPPKSKANEVYQPDQYYSSPPPVALAGEQSVSRGLFIQTITEPTPTQVWYCPACLRPDDGSPMIGCDSCDGWYHWTCVGITQAPSEDVEWYCGTCVDRLSKKKIKKRKKKE